MKVIFDSNVIISAFATHGFCHGLFEFCLENHEIYLNKFILTEVEEKLIKKIKIPQNIVKEIFKYFNKYTQIIEHPSLQDPVCRDKKDDEILALTNKIAIDFIITGDKDLLVIKKYNMTRIITPRNFWAMIKNDK